MICRSPRGNVDWNYPTLARWGIVGVVPHEGTWIEINSHRMSDTCYPVVPHEGTWIEISAGFETVLPSASFPTRERGLKLHIGYSISIDCLSFPTRERGLKSCHHEWLPGFWRRSPRGNVDWNSDALKVALDDVSRSPRGNVDWNYYLSGWCLSYMVVPHEGTWIEIPMIEQEGIINTSFPTRERGLKLLNFWQLWFKKLSFPTRERGLKYEMIRNKITCISRSPRGNVDWNLHNHIENHGHYTVVPHEGTWIEMAKMHYYFIWVQSFPTRERGLKFLI